MNPRNRKIIFAVFALVIVSGSAFTYVKYRSVQADQTASIVSLYKTQPALRMDLSSTVSGSGIVEAANQAVVRAKFAGEIVQVLHKDGDYVEAGDIIAMLDSRSYERRVSQCQTAVDAALLQVKQAEEDARLYPVQAAAEFEQAK